MGTKMKGIYKGFKYTLSQIFVVKDREMEIGFPTDVKHVAHIGWDGSSGSAPTWVQEFSSSMLIFLGHVGWRSTLSDEEMNEFNTGPDFSATSIGNSGSALSPWSSQDFGESRRLRSGSDMFSDMPSAELPNIPKKPKRKKTRSNSSPKPGSTSRSSRAAKSKTKLVEGNLNPTNIEVA